MNHYSCLGDQKCFEKKRLLQKGHAPANIDEEEDDEDNEDEEVPESDDDDEFEDMAALIERQISDAVDEKDQ